MMSYPHNYIVKIEAISIQYQRTNGPVNAHLLSWPSKAKTYKTWKTYGKEMPLTFNTHIPS